MGVPERPGRRSNTPGPTGQRVAKNLRQLRDACGLSTVRLAEVLAELGQPLWPTAITKTEAGDRRVDVDDLVALAVALGVSPNRLLLEMPSGGMLLRRDPDDTVGREVDTFHAESIDLTSAIRVPLLDAWEWAGGDHPLPTLDEAPIAVSEERANAFRRENRPHAPTDRYFDKAELRKHPEIIRQAAALVRAARQEGVSRGLLHDFIELAAMTAINGHTDTVMPVVAAIVTSARGVLVNRRKDGRPPWGFVAGEVHKDPAERPEDAAVREVKEETGLEVRAGDVIGERDHPATGRRMIYIAAKPVRGTRVLVGDDAELAEVRWVSLAEAEELMPDMFGPVRDYLARTLKAGAK